MISNKDLVEKTKPILKGSYLQVFVCLLLASVLPQIFLSISPENILLNVLSVCVSAYIQVGIALYCLGVYKGNEVGFSTIFSRFNGFKPILFMLLLGVAIVLGLILFVVPGIIIALMYSIGSYKAFVAKQKENPKYNDYDNFISLWKDSESELFSYLKIMNFFVQVKKSVEKNSVNPILTTAEDRGVKAYIVGKVGGMNIKAEGAFDLPISTVREKHENFLPELMS